MNKKLLTISAIILSLILIAVAFVYWFTPAGSLPAFFPGYQAGSAVVHFKHGLGSLLLGLVLAAYAWFESANISKK